MAKSNHSVAYSPPMTTFRLLITTYPVVGVNLSSSVYKEMTKKEEEIKLCYRSKEIRAMSIDYA
jgi:hypothetical protein